MEIINAHAHIYPEKIAERATVAIGEFYNLNMTTKAGTANALIKEGRRSGVSKYVVHSVATTAHQVRSINEFLRREMDAHEEFIGFMAMHEDLSEQEISDEISWAIDNGFKGIKLHPDFQKFYIDGENAEKIYRAASNRLPILMHMGDDRYEFSKPHRLVKMARKYPQVNFIAAHFGGYLCWDDAYMYKGLENVYFDTCSSLAFLDKKRAKEIIDMLGADRFFFGTDFPMWDTAEELNRLNALDLNDKEREMILANNLKRLLKID